MYIHLSIKKDLVINKYLIIAVRLIISGIFLFSAITKLLNPKFIENILYTQGILSDYFVASIISRVLIGTELAIGLLYLQPFYIKHLVTPITLLLLIGFSIQIIYLLITGSHFDCGCFGGVVKLTPIISLLKNVFILILVVVVYVNGPSRNEKKIIPVILIISALAGTVLAAPVHLKTENIFLQYTDFVNEGKVDLSHGIVLIAIFNLDCKHCQSVATELSSLQKELPNFPKLYILFYNEGSGSVESFNAASNTHFPYHLIGANEFYTLIGTAPPRIYILNDGEIYQYLDDDVANHLRKLLQYISEQSGISYSNLIGRIQATFSLQPNP